MLGKPAPQFTSTAVEGQKFIENFSFEQYLGKYIVFFFYPADFSELCPTEILGFQEKIDEFKSLDTVIVGCSTDSKFAHQKWLSTSIKEGGIQGVQYPIVSDQDLTIAMKYGVLAGEHKHKEDMTLEFEGVPMSYRATFIIDKKGIIRHYSVNEFPMGRDVNEVLRLVSGIKHIDETGGSCPANWRPLK